VRVRTIVARAVIAVAVLAVGAWLLPKISPYKICIYYYEMEASETAATGEIAEDFAKRLCKAKIPWRN